LWRVFDRDEDGDIMTIYPSPHKYKYDGNDDKSLELFNKIDGNLDNLKKMSFPVYQYYDYGHIRWLFDQMKKNNDEVLCFNCPIQYLLNANTNFFSSPIVACGNILFIEDFSHETVVVCNGNGNEYKLNKDHGFPLYSIHLMQVYIKNYCKKYHKNLTVKCWIGSNKFMNFFLGYNLIKTNKFKCLEYMIDKIE
jgi:hypothetical protein